MATLDIDASDFIHAAEALEPTELRRIAGRTVTTVMVGSANAVRRNVRARAARHRRSGHMAGRVQYDREGSGFGIHIRVRAGGPVAHLLEDGTRPHEIGLGKNSGQLGGRGGGLTIRGSGSVNSRWAGGGSKAVRGAGADILAVRQKVRHPGTKAAPFFEPGVEDSQAEIQDLIDQGAASITEGVALKLERRR